MPEPEEMKPLDRLLDDVRPPAARTGVLAPLSRVVWGIGAAFVFILTHPGSPVWAPELVGMVMVGTLCVWTVTYLWMVIRAPQLLWSERYAMRMQELHLNQRRSSAAGLPSMTEKPKELPQDLNDDKEDAS